MRNLKIILCGLLLCQFSHAISNQWVQLYVDCLCFTGEAQECLRDLASRNPLPPETTFANHAGNLHHQMDRHISAMNTALIVIDTQLELAQPEKRSCLAPKQEDLKGAIHYALAERSRLLENPQNRSQSFAVIGALSRLAQEIYTRAYRECLNPSGITEVTRYEAFFPQPSECLKRNAASR